MDYKNEDQKNNVPKWLKELQENSWELELLISGGAIFTLFQVSDVWINWLESMQVISFLPGRNVFLLLGTLGLETLKLGFILHLVLRSFWLSMVCINYVFPNGINKERVKWKKPFRIKIEEKEDLQSPIVFVDKLCGIVMYLSIISSFLLSGVIFTIFVTVSIPIMFDVNTGYVGVIFLVAFSVYIADLVFGGLLRKIPYVSYLTFPFFTFYDYFTFRKVYQKPALLFYTNITKWKFALSTFVFFALAATFSYLNTYRVMHWPNVFDERAYRWQMTDNEIELHYKNYRDELPEGTLSRVYIQSKIIKENYIELFIQYGVVYDELVAALPGNDENKILSDIFKVSINDSIYKDVEWFKVYYSMNVNMGLTALIPIDHLEDGKHVIKLGCSQKLMKNSSKIPHFEEKCRDFSIPFWKDTEVTISE